MRAPSSFGDRKSTRLNSSHTEIYTLSLHDALPISTELKALTDKTVVIHGTALTKAELSDMKDAGAKLVWRSEEHTSELQSHRDLHSFPTRRSSDLHRAEGADRQDRGDPRHRPDQGRALGHEGCGRQARL